MPLTDRRARAEQFIGQLVTINQSGTIWYAERVSGRGLHVNRPAEHSDRQVYHVVTWDKLDAVEVFTPAPPTPEPEPEFARLSELPQGTRFRFEKDDTDTYECRGRYGHTTRRGWKVLVRRDDGYTIPVLDARVFPVKEA